MILKTTPAQFALNIAAISGGALAAAFVAQYAFGLAPCELCIYQRIPYAFIVGLGMIAGFGPSKFRKPILYTIAALFAVECAIAVFHVGVEQKWWEGLSSCKLNLQSSDLDAIREQILNGPRALCGDVAWSLFGISMAGYNALMSFGLFAMTCIFLKRRARQR